MPKYDTTTVNYDLKKDGIYHIISVLEIITQTGKHYLKVECNSKDKNDKRFYVANLWPNEEVNATSAFGTFIASFGNDTDAWFDKWFQVSKWELRLHEIFPVAAPKIVKSDK